MSAASEMAIDTSSWERPGTGTGGCSRKAVTEVVQEIWMAGTGTRWRG